MSTKRNVGHLNGNAKFANHDQQANSFRDSAWLSSDRLDFEFRKRVEKIDWRKIAAADVESIARMVDFDALQENILNITFCDIESELDLQHVDPNYIKLFRLAQMTIEYLLHSQEFLIGKLEKNQTSLNMAINDLNQTKEAAEKSRSELAAVKAESHKRKKLITVQQHVLQNGSEMYHKCPCCAKAFINRSFLDAHIFKRHPSVNNANATPSNVSVVAPTSSALTPVSVSTPSDELLTIRDKLRQTELRLDKEIQARNDVERKLHESTASMDKKLRQEMESWQEAARAEHQSDMERYMKELRQTNEKLRIAEAALQKQIAFQSNTQASNVERLDLERQREDIAILKEQLMTEKFAPPKRQRLRAMKSNEQQFIADAPDFPDNYVRDTDVKVIKQMPSQQVNKSNSESPKVQQMAPVLNADIADEILSDEDIGSEDLSTTQGTGTLPTFDGSLSLTDKVVQERVRRQLQSNPDLLQAARTEVLSQLESELAQRGITPDVSGINENRFKTVLSTLASEKAGFARNIRNFYDLRNQLSHALESQSKLKQQAFLANAATPPQAPTRKTGQRLQRLADNGQVQENDAAAPALSSSRLSYTTADSMTFTGTSMSDAFDSEGEDMRDGRGKQRADSEVPPGHDSKSEDISDWDDDTASSLEVAAKPLSSTPAALNASQRAATLPAKSSSSMLLTNNNSSLHSPVVRAKSSDNDISLRSYSSIEDAAAPQPSSSAAQQAMPRGIIHSSTEPTTSLWNSGSLKGKKLRSTVTFSDELESVED